jgi:hypothetical protein
MIVERVTLGRASFGIIGCRIGGVLALRYTQIYPSILKKVMSRDALGMASPPSTKPL